MKNEETYNKEVREELEDLAPKLAGLPRDKPYEVPGYYFNVIADKALKRAQEEPVAAETIWSRLLGKWSLQWAMAAVVVMGVTLSAVLLTTENVTPTDNAPLADMENLNDADFEILLAGMENEEAGLYLTDDGLIELEASITFVDNSFNTDDLYMYDLDEEIMMEDLL